MLGGADIAGTHRTGDGAGRAVGAMGD
jgi:hypothetical protein